MNLIKNIFIQILIASSVALVGWVSHFYRFPQYETPVVFLGSGIILGLLFRMGAKALPALFIGLFVCHFQFIAYKFLVSFWLSGSMLVSGWLALVYLRRFFSDKIVDQPVHNYLHFYIAAILISPVTNILLDLPLIFLIDRLDIIKDIRQLIFSYTFGEALGSLVFAPAIILFGRQFHLQYAYADFSAFRTEKILWLATAAMLVLLTLMLGKYYFFAGLLDAELLLFPMIIWSALRLGVVFTNIAVAIISYAVFTFHFFGIAGTSGEMTPPQVLGMLLLIITLAVLGQLVAATTLERRKKELLLEQAILHDPITGLPNVLYLRKDIESVTQVDLHSDVKHMLGYISICNYEALMQGYGIEARNALYCQFGGFLQFETNSDIKIYRVSGPVFALLLEDKHERSIKVMRNLAEKVKYFKFIWEDRPFHINAVFSLVPVNYTPGELHGPLEHASALVEKAYEQGNIGSVIVNGNDQNRKKRIVRADWLGKINEALAKDIFTLVAQPIVPINKASDTNDRLYFEVLLRLQAPNGKLEMPEEFIPHAESFNLMPNIDRWVIRHTLKWLSSVDLDIQKIGICSINLSGQSVADPKMCSDIERFIHEYKVPAKNICFEITETAAIANMYNATTFVSQLQELGCSVALDDFGSGLSSFEYLKKLPVNILKIDGSFIQNMHKSETDYAIVDAVCSVAQTMNLKTVAEYVESEKIMDLLLEMGVDYAQGYYTGRPVRLEKLLLQIEESKEQSK